MKYRDGKIGRRGILAAGGAWAVWDSQAKPGAAQDTLLQDGPALAANIAAEGEGSVQDALDDRLKSSELGSSTGDTKIGSQQALVGAVPRTVAERLDDFVSVKNFGAVGDGLTNDRSAIQAAFDSGAKKISFPRGRYIVDGGGLTVPDWLHLVGEAYQPTIGAGGAVELSFNLTSGTALDCGHGPAFDHMCFTNRAGGYVYPGPAVLTGTTATCVTFIDNATLSKCTFALWHKCIETGKSPYYIKTYAVEFNRCTHGYFVGSSAPYNVHIDSPISRLTEIFFGGNVREPTRNIKIFGGSIEGYSTVASGFLDLSVFGTYFETIPERADAIAIDPGVNRASVALFGCLVYMNNTLRFVSMSDRTDMMLTSAGNVFDGIGQAQGTCLYLPLNGSVSLSGDRYGRGHPSTHQYVDNIVSALRYNVNMPIIPAGNALANYSGIQLVGGRGYMMLGLSAEPDQKAAGLIVMADGNAWDPLGRAAGRPYQVLWQGDRWRSVSGQA